MRTYERFSLEGANFRICSSHIEPVIEELKLQRSVLSNYIKKHPEFMDALTPIDLISDPPEIVRQMEKASKLIGIGPMASVAGTMAQFAVHAGLAAGATEAIVENGGDIYLQSQSGVMIGIYAKGSPLSGKLAFAVEPEEMPVAICSSSSKMGHSLSFGDCNLATVFSRDAALADAAATHVCNSVKNKEDINRVLEEISTIPGIRGALVIKDDQIGLIGDLPQLVKAEDTDLAEKITVDKKSDHTICLS